MLLREVGVERKLCDKLKNLLRLFLDFVSKSYLNTELFILLLSTGTIYCQLFEDSSSLSPTFEKNWVSFFKSQIMGIPNAVNFREIDDIGMGR